MRHATLLLLLLVLPAQADNKGEELFRQMEDTLKNAKTFQCAFEVTIDEGRVNSKGILALAEGNKFRLEMAGKKGDREFKNVAICDGTTLAVSEGKDGKWEKKKEGPKALRDHFLRMFGKAGLTAAVEVPPEEQFQLTNFKPGKKVQLAGQEVQLLEYKISFKGDKAFALVTVWLDTKSHLPLKRALLSYEEGKKKATITETYTRPRVDEKIDAKTFQVPK
jgi:outer membrane lipoprotein-sorting protein